MNFQYFLLVFCRFANVNFELSNSWAKTLAGSVVKIAADFQLLSGVARVSTSAR